MSATDSSATTTDSTEAAPLDLSGGGGCDCGCCGPSDAEETLSREEEIVELRRLRAQTEERLAELDAESITT